jgi:hypothetical protein
MKLESHHSVEDKRKWKIVRTDSYIDVPGDINSADEATGECNVTVQTHEGPKTQALNFGPNGFRLVGRR